MKLKQILSTRRNQNITIVTIMLIIMISNYLAWSVWRSRRQSAVTTSTSMNKIELTRRKSGLDNISRSEEIKMRYNLELTLKHELGLGCKIPKLDPHAPEAMKFFETPTNPINCEKMNGFDWAKCHLSKCKIKKYILENYTNVECTYRDIIYDSDWKYHFGDPVNVVGNASYILERTDHVKVECWGSKNEFGKPGLSKWKGHLSGHRKLVQKPSPLGREDTINVLIFVFDTTSKNNFIRHMRKSHKYLNDTMKAFISEGFNILGDGTLATLTPLLTGKNELELPDVRHRIAKLSVDVYPLIWYKLKDDGYTTAYYEDSPFTGTFQFRFTGFNRQVSDHSLRSVLMDNEVTRWSHKGKKPSHLCFGEAPIYKLLIDVTKKFHTLPGKRFSLTFSADISHDDLNRISLIDDDFTDFLNHYWTSGLNNNTLLVVMGDHGPRYDRTRRTYYGKLEERLPYLSIVLPKKLKQRRPNIEETLKKNTKLLMTPHDLHTTILDALDLRQYWNPYKIKGAHLKRGLTLFEPIPSNRSCSEAGIEPHWCSCAEWEKLSPTDPLIKKAANNFMDHINQLTKEQRSLCAVRDLKSIEYVQRLKANDALMSFDKSTDYHTYHPKFGATTQIHTQHYRLKVTVGPGEGIYEASMKYNIIDGNFTFSNRDISRISKYDTEPKCITATHPHLLSYCYCK